MKRAAKIVASLGASVVLLAALYFARNGETEPAGEALRRGNAGAFAKTASGTTHFQLGGHPAAKVVVLIHGVSGPMKVWDETFADLVRAGYRVLRYDLYGRGLSDRVAGPYDEQLYDLQLIELLASLDIPQVAALVGSSMGGVIAAGFANRHPERVAKVVLIGPAGFPIEATPASRLLDVPLIGEYMMGAFGSASLMEHHLRYFVHPESFGGMNEAFADQLKVQGTKAAILSTMRHMPVQDFRKGYETLGASGKPVLIVWGREDRTFPFENHVKAQAYVPQASFVAIDAAAHLPQYENPGRVSLALRSFLQ